MASSHFTPGAKFGRLTFIERIPQLTKGNYRGLFRCDCGTEKIFYLQNVRRGLSRSCGCLKTSDWLRSVFEFGQRFGRLVYVGEAHSRGKARRIVARCDCGVVRDYDSHALVSMGTKSCGCLRLEINRASARAQMTTHGMSKTPTFKSWSGAISRCYTPTDDHYQNYGGRGIAVCERWRNSFENFYADMGARPSGMTLDRIYVNGPYAPWNCRWATNIEQSNNRRANQYVTRDGRTQTVTQWAREFGIRGSLAFKRRAAGWPESRWFEPSQAPKR